MAAGLGFKTFATGDVLSATDVNGYLMQGVLVFASATARDAAITSPQEGQFAYLKDTNVTTYYTGSAWTNLDTTGMTNPMTTTGDTIYSSSGSTPARLGIGSTGQVLTVAGGVPTWASPSSGGGYTQLATGSLTGSSVSITSISGSYKALVMYLDNTSLSGQQDVKFTLNNNTSTLYGYSTINNGTLSTSGSSGVASGYIGTFPGYQDSTSAVLNFPFYASTRRPTWVINTASYGSNGSPMAFFQFGGLNAAGPVTSIQLFPVSGTFSTGTYTLYGVN